MKYTTSLSILSILFTIYFVGLGIMIQHLVNPIERTEYISCTPKQVTIVTRYGEVNSLSLPYTYDTADKLHKGKVVIEDVRVTAYNNEPGQTDTTPNIMASGRYVYEGAVALSRDLLAKHKVKWGDLVCLENPGSCYIVEDTMNARYDNRVTEGSGNRVDIFLFSKDQALKVNYKTKLKIIKWR